MQYTCTYCDTFVFDSTAGEQRAAIKPRTVREALPEAWRCPVCGKPKSYLQPIGAEEFKAKKAVYEELYPIKRAAEKEKNIADFMNIAREQLSGICAVNKVCDGNPERLCMGQKYGKAIGYGGAGQGRTFDANFKALEKYNLVMRVIKENKEPEMEKEFLGNKIKIPVMVSSSRSPGNRNNKRK